MESNKPSIRRRYTSTLIDGLLIIGMIIFISYLFQGDGALIKKLRVGTILFMFFAYEPIFTAFFCTLGQRITKIRIIDNSTQTQISIIQAYFRYVVKVLLGMISFFTILFSKEKRAIHDYLSGSLVIYKTD